MRISALMDKRGVDFDPEAEADGVMPHYVYSGQKLQYTKLKKAETRNRLKGEKNVMFTYSKDFLSQSVSMVDETRLKQEAEQESRARWKTQRGFVYPAPKKPQEYNAHPHKPSDSRIDILCEPWVENEFHPQPLGRDSVLPDDQEVDFDTIPSNGKMIFGGFEHPRFERDYDGNNLGNPQRLPRGRLMDERNADYFRSVHLCGEGLAAEELEAKRKAAELFNSKVVVDNLTSRSTASTSTRRARTGSAARSSSTRPRTSCTARSSRKIGRAHV